MEKTTKLNLNNKIKSIINITKSTRPITNKRLETVYMTSIFRYYYTPFVVSGYIPP